MLKCKNLFCWRVTYLYVVWSAYVFFLINCYSDNVYTLVFKVAQLWWHFCNAVYHLQSLASYRIKNGLQQYYLEVANWLHKNYIMAPLTNMVKSYVWIDMWARIFPQLVCNLCNIPRLCLFGFHCTFCSSYSCSWHNVINTGARHHDGNSFFTTHNNHCLDVFI